MTGGSDIVIVGAGVIGLLTARELLDAGAGVTVLERGRCGRESSHAGGGILAPLLPWETPGAVDALAAWSRPRFPILAQELLEETGIDIEYWPCGVIVLDSRVDAEVQAWSAASGVTVEGLDAAALRDVEPAAGGGFEHAVYLPELGQLRNPRLMEALAASVRRRGGRIIEGCEVEGIETAGERVCSMRTASGPFSGAAAVVTAGAWTAAVLGPLGAPPARPVRGQMLWYQAAPGALRRVLDDGRSYAIPRRDGVCLVGSTVEEAGFDRSTTPEARERLVEAAARLVQFLAELSPAGHWAGLRPGSPQGIPTISAHPAVQDLYIGSGHFRNGINTAPATARLLRALVLDEDPPLDARPFRFNGYNSGHYG